MIFGLHCWAVRRSVFRMPYGRSKSLALKPPALTHLRVTKKSSATKHTLRAPRSSLDIDGETFATGQRRGCIMDYTSATYLEDAEWRRLPLNIEGVAESQTDAGGCPDIPMEKTGSELRPWLWSIRQRRIEAGCTYSMEVSGTFVSQ